MEGQQDKRRRVGARVWLVMNSERRTGVLWWIGEDSVMIREDGSPGLIGFALSDEGTRWGFAKRGGESE